MVNANTPHLHTLQIHLIFITFNAFDGIPCHSDFQINPPKSSNLTQKENDFTFFRTDCLDPEFFNRLIFVK